MPVVTINKLKLIMKPESIFFLSYCWIINFCKNSTMLHRDRNIYKNRSENKNVTNKVIFYLINIGAVVKNIKISITKYIQRGSKFSHWLIFFSVLLRPGFGYIIIFYCILICVYSFEPPTVVLLNIHLY